MRLTMSKMAAALAVVVALLAGSSASAQSCATTAGSMAATVTVGQPFSFNWCVPSAESPTSIRFFRDGAVTGAAVVATSDPVTADGYRRYGFVGTELSAGTHTYQVASMQGTTQGPLSPVFTVTALAAQPTDPCGGPDPSGGSVVAGNRTITVCFPPTDTTGAPIAVTGVALYVGAARSVLAGLVIGAQQPSGRTVATAPLPQAMTAGSYALQIATISAAGVESAKSPVFSLSVAQPPPPTPATPAVKGVN